VPPGCVLAPDQPAGDWLTAERERLEAASPPAPWFLECSGPPDRCDPCAADPLDRYEVTVFRGTDTPTRAGRIRMAWGPGQLDQDPVLTFCPDREDAGVRCRAATHP